MQVNIFALLAIILAVQHCEAGPISIGDLMGDVSKVAVAGEKLRHQLENQLGAAQLDMAPTSKNIMNLTNALENLVVAITFTSQQLDNVEPENYNIVVDALGTMATTLGDLANLITSLSVQLKAETNAQSISTSGATIIGELGSISAKNIAAAANAAAPYVKKLDVALGDLANSITNLSTN
ncbi:hypothetical protein KR044_001530 [Drosophila immigrans]|nr:hypothetical protein KR044_001530 [Drosophila immigrans]